MTRIVVVGGALGGLRAAQRLRHEGFVGELAIVEAERSGPYDRPPLSKDVLAGRMPPQQTDLRIPASCEDIVWMRGQQAVGADLDARSVALASGEDLSFDGLVVATGLRPCRLLAPGPTRGRHVLRTRDDALALHSALRDNEHVVVIGAGFIGCEVAATARQLGCAVTIVAPEATPLERAVGPLVGGAIRRLHEARGVSFRLDAQVVGFDGDDDRVRSVNLAGGESLDAAVVVEAIGCEPNVEWLGMSGLDVSDGVACDEWLRAEGRDHVTAVGDVARFPLALLGGRAQRIEHWNMAGETARRAATTLARAVGIASPAFDSPFAPLPSFWSDQHGLRLQSFGVPSAGLEDVRALSGTERNPTIVGYHDDQGLVGVLGIGAAPTALAEPRAHLVARGQTVLL